MNLHSFKNIICYLKKEKKIVKKYVCHVKATWEERRGEEQTRPAASEENFFFFFFLLLIDKCMNQFTMKPNSKSSSYRWLLCLLISLLSILQFQTCLGGSNNDEEAYVTLLYGDEFLLGVRVLGKSIRDTRSNKDMVVLVSDGVSNFAKNLLRVSTILS